MRKTQCVASVSNLLLGTSRQHKPVDYDYEQGDMWRNTGLPRLAFVQSVHQSRSMTFTPSSSLLKSLLHFFAGLPTS